MQQMDRVAQRAKSTDDVTSESALTLTEKHESCGRRRAVLPIDAL